MAKIIQTGNSLAITIPTKFAKMVGAKKGDIIKISKYPHKGQIVIRFAGPKQLILSDTIKNEK